MPTYDYCCTVCDYVFEASHSYKEKPVIKCPRCQGLCEKQVSACYFSIQGGTSALHSPDMRQDLRENYGIEQVNLQSGTFHDFYQGVKRDGARVKEQMKAGEEASKKKMEAKTREFMQKKSNPSAVAKITEAKTKKQFEKRAIRLP